MLSITTTVIMMPYFHSLLTGISEQKAAMPDSRVQQNTVNEVWHATYNA